MKLTLITMLSKTKKVFTTHLPVLCSVASLRIILSITWRMGRLSLLFVPPTERRRNGDYYVWIEWDGKYELIDDSIEFEDYIKDDPRFSICIYVEDMDEEEAIKAGKRFVENNEKNGIYCDT